MEFTERRYSVLLVSSSPKFNESMLALLPESRFYPVAAVSDVSSARRRLLENKYDIVIINAPLPDDFGTRLAHLHMRKQRRRGSSFGKGGALSRYKWPGIPFWRAGAAEARLLADGVPIAAAPCGTRERLRRMEQKTASIEEKMEEIRIINRAKLLLMEQLKMTEKEAHRFIEKQAMDRCVTRITIAQSILSTYK